MTLLYSYSLAWGRDRCHLFGWQWCLKTQVAIWLTHFVKCSIFIFIITWKWIYCPQFLGLWAEDNPFFVYRWLTCSQFRGQRGEVIHWNSLHINQKIYVKCISPPRGPCNWPPITFSHLWSHGSLLEIYHGLVMSLELRNSHWSNNMCLHLKGSLNHISHIIIVLFFFYL